MTSTRSIATPDALQADSEHLLATSSERSSRPGARRVGAGPSRAPVPEAPQTDYWNLHKSVLNSVAWEVEHAFHGVIAVGVKGVAMKRSGARKFAWFGGLVLALATVVIAVASAQAAPALKKNYTVSITPGLAAPGSTGSYTLTLTNSGGSQSLGSANIEVPSGFTDVAVISPSMPGWSMSKSNPQEIQWRAGTSSNAIQPGGAKSTATLTVTAASHGSFSGTCSSTSPWTWTSAAKQSNDFSGTGNDFTPTADASLTVAALAFTTQPVQTLSKAILPAVEVTLQDDCGTTLSSVPGDVGVSLGNNPSEGTLSGGTPQALSSGGVATFKGLTIDASGVGYTLLATPGSSLNIDPSAPSSPFNIIDTLCTHIGGSPTCTASNPNTTVSVPVPAGSAQTALSVGNPTEPPRRCPTTGTLTQVGSVVTIAPQSYPTRATVSVTLVYAASVATTPGTSSYVVCVLMSDGSSVQALSCTKSAPPCVSNRSRNGTGGLVIVLTIDATDPGGVTYN